MRKLDESLGVEKERAAAELLSSFEQMSLSGSTPNLMAERERIEDHFRRIREEQLKGMMDKISTEEKTRTVFFLFVSLFQNELCLKNTTGFEVLQS
jgi:hypothetical protein